MQSNPILSFLSNAISSLGFGGSVRADSVDPEPLEIRIDSPTTTGTGPLANPDTGLGYVGYDSLQSTGYLYPVYLTQEYLDTLYRQSWQIRRIVDTIPESMSREWGELKLGGDGDPKIIQDTKTYLEKLLAPKQFTKGQCYANLYGGAAIVLLIDDGETDYSKPVNESRIRSVEKLRVLDPYQIFPDQSVYAFTDPFEVELYQLGISLDQYLGGATDILSNYIHSSRILRFDGAHISENAMRINRGWSDPIIRNVIQTVKAYDQGIYSAAEGLKGFEILIHKIAGMATIKAATKGWDALRSRMRQNQVAMGLFRSFLIDKDTEDVNFISRRFSGISEILERLKDHQIAASGLPPSVMAGEFPSGLGATGISERLQWADQIRVKQSLQFLPPLQKLLKYIFLAKDGPTKGEIPSDWEFEFKSLFQLTDEEKIALRSQQATTDKTYVDAGILLQDEVSNSRFGGSSYSFDTVLDLDARKKAKEQKEKQAKDLADIAALEDQIPEDENAGGASEEIS